MNKFIVILLSVLFPLMCCAQGVKFNRVVMRKNQVYNGRRQTQVHYNITINGAKGHRCRLYAYIYSTNSDIHTFANGKQMFKTSDVLVCNNNASGWKGWVGFYNDEMNPLPGARTYYMKVYVKDLTTDKWIANYPFIEFNMRGRSGNTPNTHTQPTQPTRPVQPSRPQGGGTQTVCMVCKGSGVLYEYCGHIENTTEPIFCPACKTSHCKLCTNHKQCLICMGRGQNDGRTCTSCNGSGLDFDVWSCHHHYSESGSLYEYCSRCNYRHCTRCSCHKTCMGCNGTGHVFM